MIGYEHQLRLHQKLEDFHNRPHVNISGEYPLQSRSRKSFIELFFCRPHLMVGAKVDLNRNGEIEINLFKSGVEIDLCLEEGGNAFMITRTEHNTGDPSGKIYKDIRENLLPDLDLIVPVTPEEGPVLAYVRDQDATKVLLDIPSIGDNVSAKRFSRSFEGFSAAFEGPSGEIMIVRSGHGPGVVSAQSITDLPDFVVPEDIRSEILAVKSANIVPMMG